MSEIKFGTDGWRDYMYDRFNLPNVQRVVNAIASYTKDNHGAERGLVIGYDARFFSDFFAKKAAEVLTAQGIRVFLSKRDYPTPLTAFAVTHYQAFGAIMFTASHNPPEYNGVKFIPEYAGPASLEITKAIEGNLIKHSEADTASGEPVPQLVTAIDPTEAYLKLLRKLIDVDTVKKAGLNLVIDPMYATGRGFLTALFKDCSVREIHNRRDPLFGGAMPDPQKDYLGELIALVQSKSNSIGLATDGDADRFGIVDSDGTYINPNQVISLLLWHLITNRGLKGIAARSVATTHMIDRLGDLYGVEAVETPVGFKYIGEMMRTRPVIIGGEESGGLSIQGHLPEKDGILACALMAELRAVTGKPLLATLKDLYTKVGEFYSNRLDIHLSESAKATVLELCKVSPPEMIGTVKVNEVRTLDGFKFILANGSWFLIRPSGTEPLIRIYFEANSNEDLQVLTTDVRQLLEQWSKTA
ncbi:MAG: phosphoglucomutase/phosphomannomutase family protein [Firmicutes bacterium]|nr:phosphoglucomutase/phosphomannomutase family protein [Bacillota bacterium]